MAGGQELKAVLRLAGEIDPTLRKTLQHAAKEAERLQKNGKSVGAGFSGGASVAKNALAGVGKAAAAAAKMAGAAMLAAGAAVAGLGIAGIKTGIEYESAFAGVKKTVDMSSEEAEKMSDAIIGMSLAMPTSATEIAGVAEAAGQLGIAKSDIEDFTKTMVMLGDATNLSAEEGATTFARFANVTGMDPAFYSNLGSSIVALGNSSATTEAEIAAMAQNLAAAGSQVNMTEAEILGVSAALSSVGMEAQAGGTSMSKFLVEMQLATETGGGKLQELAKIAGVSSEEFSAAFKDNAAGALTMFLDGLGNIEEGGPSAIALLDEMGVSEARLRDALLRGANASDMFSESVETSNNAWEENTALTKEAEQRYATMESQIGILKNGVKALGIEFYQSVDGPMMEVVKGAQDMLAQLKNAFETGGLSAMVEQVGDIGAKIATKIATAAPDFLKTGSNLIKSLLNGIKSNAGELAKGAADTVVMFVDEAFSMIPLAVDVGFELVTGFVSGIADNGEAISSGALQSVTDFFNVLAEQGPRFIEEGGRMITGLVKGLTSGDSLKMMRTAGVGAIVELTKGLLLEIPNLVDLALDISDAINEAVQSVDWLSLAGELLLYLSLALVDVLGVLGGWLIKEFLASIGINYEASEFRFTDLLKDDKGAAEQAGQEVGSAYASSFNTASTVASGGGGGGGRGGAAQTIEAPPTIEPPPTIEVPLMEIAALDTQTYTNEINNVVDYAKTVLPEVGTSFAEVSAQIISEAGAINAQAGEQMASFSETITNGMTSLNIASTSTFANMKSDVVSVITSLNEMVIAVAKASAGIAGISVSAGGGAPRAGMAKGDILKSTAGGIPVLAAEAGYDEAYIPINRSPRSVGLLAATAARMGIALFGEGGNTTSINYNANVTVGSGASKNDVKKALDADKKSLFEMLDEYFAERGRTGFEFNFADAY